MTAKKKTSRKKTGGDDALRADILAAALLHAPFDGFSDATLNRAASEVGASKDDIKRLFPDGPLSLVEAFSISADDMMETALGGSDLSAMKIRDRIRTAVLARIDAVRDHKEAARRAAAFLTLPNHAATGAKLLYSTVDRIWYAIGDTSTDFNFYSKRAILAGVYSATLMRWFTDHSEDESPTKEFLDARIGNVMQFEKFKAEFKERTSGFPSFAEIMGRFQRGASDR